MIDYLNEMDKVSKEKIIEENSDALPKSELLKKQISDYEIFIKYLNFYINDIQLRIRRLNSMLEKELNKDSKCSGLTNSERLKISSDRKEKAIKLYNSGMSVKEIAKELGITERPVYVYLDGLLNKYSNSERLKISSVRKEEAIKLYNSGMKIDDIVKELGISKRQIYFYINGC